MARKKTDVLSLFDLTRMYPTEESAVRHLEQVRWGDKPVCTRCGSMSRITEQKRDLGRYWCGDCRAYFTARTGTPMEHNRVSLHKWMFASYLFVTARKGISSLQMSKELAVTQKTAWYMLQRLRAGCADYLSELCGTVEVDATYLGGKEKNKHARRKLNAGTGMVGKQGVLGVRQRGDGDDGALRLFPIASENRAVIERLLMENVAPGSIVCSDGHGGYKGLGDRFEHRSVNHSDRSAKRFVDGMARTNGIESVWALLKRGFTGTYHHWSKKHCGLYINEFAFRLNQGACHRDTQERQDALFRIMFGKTLTYQKLTA